MLLSLSNFRQFFLRVKAKIMARNTVFFLLAKHYLQNMNLHYVIGVIVHKLRKLISKSSLCQQLYSPIQAQTQLMSKLFDNYFIRFSLQASIQIMQCIIGSIFNHLQFEIKVLLLNFLQAIAAQKKTEFKHRPKVSWTFRKEVAANCEAVYIEFIAAKDIGCTY